MRGISSPALFELRAQKMAECRGLAPLARRHALFSKQARFACPVGIPKMVGVGRLALPRLFGFEPLTEFRRAFFLQTIRAALPGTVSQHLRPTWNRLAYLAVGAGRSRRARASLLSTGRRRRCRQVGGEKVLTNTWLLASGFSGFHDHPVILLKILHSLAQSPHAGPRCPRSQWCSV